MGAMHVQTFGDVRQCFAGPHKNRTDVHQDIVDSGNQPRTSNKSLMLKIDFA